MFIVFIFLNHYIFVLLLSLVFLFLLCNKKFNLNIEFINCINKNLNLQNDVFFLSLTLNFLKRYKYVRKFFFKKLNFFKWKPIFKKNMYLSYFSENVLWY